VKAKEVVKNKEIGVLFNVGYFFIFRHFKALARAGVTAKLPSGPSFGIHDYALQ